MIRFFIGTLVPLLLLVMQLWGTPVKPPTLTEANLTVTAKGGIRNPMREKPEGVIPVGAEDFFYYGTWHSTPTNKNLKVGLSTTLTGYTGTTWKPASSVVETGNSNAFFVLADANGNVKWALSSNDGNFSDMAATVAENKIYVVVGVKPVRRAEPRTDQILARWQWGSEVFEIQENFTNNTNPSKFTAPLYFYILEISLDGKILNAYKPFEDADPATTQGAFWYSVRRLLYADKHLILDGKIAAESGKAPNKKRFTLKYGKPEKTVEGGVNGKQILTQIDISNPEQPKVAKIDYVTNQETISYMIDAVHVANDAIYFSMTISNGKNNLTENVHFLDRDIEVAGQKGGHYLLKTDRRLKEVKWVKKLPQSIVVNFITHSGKWLYVAGDYDKKITWGTTTLLNEIEADNLAFWGTVSIADGTLGQAQFVQAGYAENVGIAVAGDLVLWQFDHRLAGSPNMGAQGTKDILFGDGKQYATEDDLSDEDETWVMQKGLAVYDKNTFELRAFTHTIASKAYMTLIPSSPLSIGRGSPYVSGNGRYMSFIAQSGTGNSSTVEDIQLFDAAFPTPKADGYGNFCAFYGTLQCPPVPEYTLTIPASVDGVVKVTYSTHAGTTTETTASGDLHIRLKKEQDFTVEAIPNVAGKQPRFRFDADKIGTTVVDDTFWLLADATLRVVFLDSFTLAVEENKVEGCSYKLYQNDKLVTTPATAAVVKDDILKLEFVVLGYTPKIVAEGATLVSGTTYKVNGDANVKFTISYTKDESQWYTITYTEALQPSGRLVVVDERNHQITAGTTVLRGTRIVCNLMSVPLGYVPDVKITGLTKIEESKQQLTFGTNYKITYEVTDNATIEAVLEKDETLWHTIAFDATGTDAQGKSYTLKVMAIGSETMTPVEPNGKLPQGAVFVCIFTTEGGAYPTLTVTGAKKLTKENWNKYGHLVYEVEGDVQLSVQNWTIKTVPVSISVNKSAWGSVKVSYLKDGSEIEVKDGDQIPWGVSCKIETFPNPGHSVKELKLTGFATPDGGRYKLEGSDEASVEAIFEQEIYSFTTKAPDGITILGQKISANGNKKPIKQLLYGDKIELTVTNNDEANLWLKSLKLTNLEKVEGEENTYTVKGNVIVEAEVVKLYSLALKHNDNVKYEVSYLEKEKPMSVTVENADVAVKADDGSTVTVKVEVDPTKCTLLGIKPLTAKPLTADPTSFTFSLSEATTVEVLTEVIQKLELTVHCGENGKLLVTYTEQHAAQSGEKSEEVTGDKTLSIEKGTTVKLKAMPSEHFRVATFEVGKNAAFPQEGSFVLSEATKVSVAFEKVSYAVAVISHRGKGTLTVTTLERQTNIELKQGDLVFESEKLQIAYKADPAFDAKPETLKVEGLKQEGDAYVVTGAVSVSIDFVPRTKPAAVDDALLAEVVVAPNPFDNQLRITSYELRGEYALLNAQGVVVASGVLENAETRINTSLLPAGMYLLRLSTESGATKTYRVVKQ